MLSAEQKTWLDFLQQCKAFNISVASPEAEEIRKKTVDPNNNASAFTNNKKDDEVTNHLIRHISVLVII